jgi:hypothetical protein
MLIVGYRFGLPAYGFGCIEARVPFAREGGTFDLGGVLVGFHRERGGRSRGKRRRLVGKEKFRCDAHQLDKPGG